MKRLALALGCLAGVLAPPSADAQQADRPAIVGLVSGSALNAAFIDAFRRGLHELGHVEGRTVVIEHVVNEVFWELPHDTIRLRMQGTQPILQLAARGASAFVTADTQTAVYIVRLAPRVPVVVVGADDFALVGQGTSIARPTGNVTGLSNYGTALSGKRLELLKAAVPGLSRVAALYNGYNSGHYHSLVETRRAAEVLGVTVEPLGLRPDVVHDDAIRGGLGPGIQGVVVFGDATIDARRDDIVRLLSEARLPAVFDHRDFVDAGGLMSYGPDRPEMFRRAAVYVDKILKGAKPGDLPIEQPTKFELVINLKMAKTLGIEIPPSLLARADEVIE
jgi:putative ABC transport system substrate-binding protein